MQWQTNDRSIAKQAIRAVQMNNSHNHKITHCNSTWTTGNSKSPIRQKWNSVAFLCSLVDFSFYGSCVYIFNSFPFHMHNIWCRTILYLLTYVCMYVLSRYIYLKQSFIAIWLRWLWLGFFSGLVWVNFEPRCM